MNMSRAYVQTINKAEAWRAYKAAFHDFSESVRRLQTMTTGPHPDRAAIEAALLEVERARVIYETSRDVLAQELLPASRRADMAHEDSEEATTERVRDIAELLWETAGRPEGTADEDWRAAEAIVRRASAA